MFSDRMMSRGRSAVWTPGALFFSLGLLAFGSCSNVRVQGDPSFRLESDTSYAWRPSTRTTASSEDGSVPVDVFKKAVEKELAKRGLFRAPAATADLLFEANLGVEVRVVRNDPTFDLYAEEKREDGILSLDIFQAKSRSRLWSGETRHRLRYAAHSSDGVIGSKWISTGERRNWRVYEVVSKLMEQI